jgi:uncharacterized membrane protein
MHASIPPSSSSANRERKIDKRWVVVEEDTRAREAEIFKAMHFPFVCMGQLYILFYIYWSMENV